MIIRSRTILEQLQKGKNQRCSLTLEFFRRPQKISHWFLEAGPSVSVGQERSFAPGLRPQKPQENSARPSLPLVLPRPFRPKALPNTDQLSSNCVSRLARSFDPSATVIPLQALGPEPFVYTRARARAHTYVHACDVARNPGIPCRGDVATGSARSDASNTPLRWKQWSATGFSLGGNSRIRIASRTKREKKREGREGGGYRFKYTIACMRFSDFHEEDKRENV